MKYRAEIDGLRALAVVPVILFHAGFELFKGGFVGVDVFFVISGFLITTIIINEMEEGKFSLVKFYERRARRILPALFFVILTCIPFAWLLLMQGDMKDFAKSIMAVATFSSNILFWSESGYFDSSAEMKPLLHTWSLAVEEQYYIIFPLLLMFTWRFGKKVVLVVLAIGFLSSLGMAHWGAYHKPTAAFYLLPTRGWELLIGVFCAFYMRRDRGVQTAFQQGFSLLGILLIVAPLFLFDSTTPTPSLYTLVPTIGTALVIVFASEGTVAWKILSQKFVVAIGLLSYSAYLWHQPILAFMRHRKIEEITSFESCLAIALTLGLSYFSLKYIEKPFRERRFLPSSRSILATSSSLLLLSFFLAFGWQSSIAVPDVYKDWGAAVRQHHCLLQGDGETKHDEVCFSPTQDVLLWGDSHAASLSIGLREILTGKSIGFTQLTQSGCPPLFNLPVLHHRKTCNDVNLSVLDHIRKNKYRVIVLHAAWLHPDYPLSSEEFESVVVDSFKSIQSASPQSKVIVIGNVPRWKVDVYKVVRKGELISTLDGKVYAKANTLPEIDSALSTLSTRFSFRYASARNVLCQKDATSDMCLIGFSDAAKKLTNVAYVDWGHASRSGSEYLARNLIGDILN
ncbi:predicted acyltransferase [Hahella chejuensis KCTC 2396]|uniref:Predicted acyltransferase n=1 Tax=Hahella chejuensis (strain KCTC 2396) TaxID=349521 RepID=Q2SCJ4_HAHCH|nr:acyltransferase family protein [Hahella chejuensis]ABC31630.1 predicted acyltransferase [Hahella chejuensis KCTC 2396]